MVEEIDEQARRLSWRSVLAHAEVTRGERSLEMLVETPRQGVDGRVVGLGGP